MGWFPRWRARRNDELNEEMNFHLAMREQWNLDRGMQQESARRSARLQFGNPQVWRERMQEIDWMTLPTSVW